MCIRDSYTLAGFDEADLNAVYCPFCAGCGSIVKFPFLEMDASHPRAVLGMFDVSARPFVPGSTLSFAIPMNKFAAMINSTVSYTHLTLPTKRIEEISVVAVS